MRSHSSNVSKECGPSESQSQVDTADTRTLGLEKYVKRRIVLLITYRELSLCTHFYFGNPSGASVIVLIVFR